MPSVARRLFYVVGEGLTVTDYLNWVFERIRNRDFNKMEDLVPWSKMIPESVRL